MKFFKLGLSTITAIIFSFSLTSCSSSKGVAENPPFVNINKEEQASQDKASPFKTIYFDFNKYNIREDQVENAKSIAEALKKSKTTKIQIQGNTDDRGSVEYNMALGTKRAESLKKYLTSQGVDEKNISTVSYGKEKPAVQGSDEKAWSQNRRDDVVEVK
jgi:peptidoglycan-associated lipoprotein